MKKYTNEHEWLEKMQDAQIWRVGITDYAQDQLGDVVTVELPKVGTEFKVGETCAVIESVKAASDIYAPLPGTISAVNNSLTDTPELVNEAAEQGGWLFEIQVDGEPDLSGLLDADNYAKLTAG